jgi:CheY-like chemotaxis protein
VTSVRTPTRHSTTSTAIRGFRALSFRREGHIREKHRKILVVDDDFDIRELLDQTVTSFGYACDTAAGAEEALDLIRQGDISLVTLDLAMPGRDGHWLLRELASDPTTNSIPIIVISAYAGRLVRTPQIVAVLWKPYDVDELDRAIKEILGPP